MTRCIIILIALLGLTAQATAFEKSLPICTVKALTRTGADGTHYEIGLRQPESTQVEPLQRVKSLAEAIHFVYAERRHHTCRPAFPNERRNCAFTTVNQRLVLNYSSQGAALEPVATLANQAQAQIVLRQMRNAYLCN